MKATCGRSSIGCVIATEQDFKWNPSFCPGSTGSDPWAKSDGLELWGADMTVSGNRIEYFPGAGISAATVQRLPISGNLIRNTSRSIQAAGSGEESDLPGIVLFNCGPASAAYRDLVRTVSVMNNTITNVNSLNQSYAFALRPMSCGGAGESSMSDITFSGNTGVNRLRASCAAGGVSKVTVAGQSSVFDDCRDWNGAVLGFAGYSPSAMQPFSCGTTGCTPQ
jgi:hypothetical protein